MGMFRAMRDLHQQSSEISKNWDVGAQMAQAQASMQSAQATMAQQTAATTIAATGIDGTATISAVRQGGAMINRQPIVELDLTVMVPGRPPLPVTVSQVVELVHLPRAQPGAQVAVKVDPKDPSVVFINWSAPTPA